VEVIDRFSYQIRFCLLGIKSLDLRAVLSHPVAFRQCERFLRERLEWVERVEVESTGKAAEIVAERCDPTLGAIASPEAADDYKLKILAHGIQDVGYNVTTFALVAIADGNKNGNGGNRSGYDNKI
jgi:prephenate dehydratase